MDLMKEAQEIRARLGEIAYEDAWILKLVGGAAFLVPSGLLFFDWQWLALIAAITLTGLMIALAIWNVRESVDRATLAPYVAAAIAPAARVDTTPPREGVPADSDSEDELWSDDWDDLDDEEDSPTDYLEGPEKKP